MIVLSYVLTAFGGILLGVFLSRLLSHRRKTIASPSVKSHYKAIPAAEAYESYAARVEGRAPNTIIINPKPAEHENPFFASFRRTWRDRRDGEY